MTAAFSAGPDQGPANIVLGEAVPTSLLRKGRYGAAVRAHPGAGLVSMDVVAQRDRHARPPRAAADSRLQASDLDVTESSYIERTAQDNVRFSTPSRCLDAPARRPVPVPVAERRLPTRCSAGCRLRRVRAGDPRHTMGNGLPLSPAGSAAANRPTPPPVAPRPPGQAGRSLKRGLSHIVIACSRSSKALDRCSPVLDAS